MSEARKQFTEGMRDGVPIALGYFAVAVALGIAAKNAGLTAVQAMVASFTNNASAGEYAAFALIGAGAGYWEVAVMTLIANARYLLMSCALSQKLHPDTPLRHSFLLAYDITDEIFGISVTREGYLNPYYTYGAMSLALPGWALGTFFGVVMGNVLPGDVVSALSVGLYGMFLAIIIPPTRTNQVLAGIVPLSFVLSFLVSRWAVFASLSAGVKTILLTVLISLGAALLFPIKEETP